MDSLLKLSDIASKAERLADNSVSFSSSSSGESSASESSCDVNAAVPADSNVQSCVPSSSSSERAIAISEADRLAIREKIKCALRKKAESYEQLLELSGAIVEDHAYERALSKLDYYKCGIQACKRIFDISNAESSRCTSDAKDGTEAAAADNDSAAPRTVKRAETQH